MPGRSDDPSAARPDGSPAVRAALGSIAGFSVLALTNAVVIACTIPLPHAGIGLRLAHHAFDAAETIGIGAFLGLLLGVFRRFAALRFWAAGIVYGAVVTPVLYTMVSGDLLRQAMVALEGRFDTSIFIALIALSSLGIGIALVLGTVLSRYRWLRLLPVVIAVIGMIVNHRVFPDDYFAGHGAVAWAAATLAGGALGPLAERAYRSLNARRNGRIALAAGAFAAVLGLFVPPENRIRYELFRNPCSISWALAATLWRTPGLRGPVPSPPAALAPWLRDRSSLPPIPEAHPRFLGRSPVIVFITIDALRADAISDPANDPLLPTMAKLKRTGAVFTRASSPGSQTAVSLTATFSGRTFSELYWSWHGKGSTRFVYAADDPSPRFPELLARRGVHTVSYCSINFLAGEFGVLRGFQEERVIPEGRRHAAAKQVIDPLLERLRRAGSGPLFLYAHLTEPHAPYDRGKQEGTDHDRYLSEVAVADAQIARVVDLLGQQRFVDRAILIISADHGEAFGEHGTFQHTKTLYEELLHVPLIVRGPGIVARAIDARVGLMDLGPTILDIFGVETPATYLGQSLLPLLRGGDAALTRPLVAEGRLRRAMVLGDDLKVIEDPRRKVVEVYDLAADPGELDNLFDRDPARADPALAALRAFFEAHTFRQAGYDAPYKP